MQQSDDIELLRQYARGGSEPAFATLVERHVNLVYSAAFRQVNDPDLAEEVSQIVFLILAKKAGTLGDRTIISGWLYRTARFAARDALKSRRRREQREQETFQMDHPLSDSAWEQIAPFLDEAMATLGDQDRNAVVLRYFEQKPLVDVGRALGVDADAAQKRVSRAVDKLRRFFVKRGLAFSAAAVIGALSAHAVQAAPAALPAAIVGVAAVKGTVAASSTATLIKGTLKLMAWAKLKTTVVIVIGGLFAAGTATVTVTKIAHAREQSETDRIWNLFTRLDLSLLDKAPPFVAMRPAKLGVMGMVSSGKDVLALGEDPRTVLTYGYNHSSTRLAVATTLPSGKFDFVANKSGDYREAFRRLAREELGLVGRKEIRETDVLLLTVKNPGAPGLKPNFDNSGGMRVSGNELKTSSASMSTVASLLEGRLSIPVIDRTALNGNYEIYLRWNGTPVDLKRVVLDQLGLELVPGRESIEMLVIEKVK